MAANSIVKSSMRMLGACARASSGVKTSRPVSAMLTSQRRQKHHATGTANPLMPRVPSRQQMTFSAEQPGHEIEIEQRPRIVDMRQGDKVSIFSKAEYEARLKKLRTYMQAEGIGAVVMTSYHNINYYSGFMFCYFGRQYGLVITPTSSTVISAGIDGGQPWRRSMGSDDNITYTDWQRDSYFYAISNLLSDTVGSVGLEFDNVSIDQLKKFEDSLPNKKVDIGRPSMRLRMVKTPEEIAVIRHGARIADIGGAAVVEALKEGVPEYEVALNSTRAMVREIANTYPEAESMDTWTWFQSGYNTDGAHNPVTSRPVQKGDILSLNCFPMIGGYYTALERTLFFDHVSDEHLRLWEINTAVHERGLELIKPGARCGDIATELNEIYKEHDLLQYRSFGYGHSFGSLCHYYGREAELELREDIDTVLEPGMVVSMEPMIMIPEGEPGAGGYREHDILVVHEDGAENITKFPYGPEHNVIKS